MTNKQTGGSAFPSGLIDPSTPDDAVQSLHKGMTLRDYFAAKAMQGFCSRHDADTWEAEEIAVDAYAQADAMLKASEQ